MRTTALLVVLLVAIAAGDASAQQPPANLSSVEGQVTRVGEFSFALNGKTYVLAGDVAQLYRPLIVEGATLALVYYTAEDGINIVRQVTRR